MKCLLFDFGGTLDADGTTWLERFHPIYKEAGLDFSKERFDRAFYDADDNLPSRHALKGLDLAQTVSLQVEDVLTALGVRAEASLIGPIAGRFVADCRVQFRRVTPVLERLSRRYRLGIVSNFYGNLDGILAAEGLRPLFSVVADSGILGVTKPESAIFLHAAGAVSASPSDCVMIGDSVKRDIKGAAGVGMKKALISIADEPPEAGQDWTIRSVMELEGIQMKCGIIAAGEGSRLAKSHPDTIKPLIKIARLPLIHWIVDGLRAAGCKDIVVLTNTRGNAVGPYLTAAFPDVKFDFVTADTASSFESFRLVSLRLAATGEEFVVSTVDALIKPEDVARFIAECRAAKAHAGLALTSYVDDEKPLWVDADANGRVLALGDGAKRKDAVTCGLYYMTRAAATAIPEAERHSRLRDFWQALVASGEAVTGVALSKSLDVDRPEDLVAAELFLTTETNQ